MHSLTDWFCVAGYLSVAIDRDMIKRGVGACREQIIGRVGEDFELHDKPQKCGTTNPCTCVADLKLPKWKENFDIESFVKDEKIKRVIKPRDKMFMS